MNTTTRQTRIPKLFLTAQTVNPPRFPFYVPNESIAGKHPITSRYSAGSYAFVVKGFCVLFSAFKIRSGTQLTQLHGCSLHSVGTNLTLTCPYPKSFVCNLPDSGRHVTSVFQGLSLSRSIGRVGENPGNEVVFYTHVNLVTAI